MKQRATARPYHANAEATGSRDVCYYGKKRLRKRIAFSYRAHLSFGSIPQRAPSRLHGARPNRKRAVDFFSLDLYRENDPDISVQQPRGTEGLGSGEVPPVEKAKTELSGARWRRNKISGVNSFQVLEEAYHTATALGSSLSAGRGVKPADEGGHVDAEKPSPGTAIVRTENLAGRQSDQGHEGRGSLPREDNLPGQRDNTTSVLKRQMSAVKTESDSKSSSPVVAPAAVAEVSAEVAAEAVDAEGLIWVDESRGTAYSVRFVVSDRDGCVIQ